MIARSAAVRRSSTSARANGCTVAALVLAAAGTATASTHDEETAPAQQFGHVHFVTSCSPQAQAEFDRAVAMLHSFHYPETVKAFSAIPQTDPSCAIAYWGIAISQRPNPLAGPFDTAALKNGLEAIEKGQAIGAKATRERDWLAAAREFFKDYESVAQEVRTSNYARAMRALAAKYPQDDEAKIFYALALNEAWDHHDKTYAMLIEADEILEPLARKYPDHPGIAHYIIHSMDVAPLAQRGLAAAEAYDKIAPSSPHALHMPSHIYSMLGLWDRSIASNLRSVAAMRQRAVDQHLEGVYPGEWHADDFMQYAYLQLGQDRKAKALMDEVGSVTKLLSSPRMGADMARAAVPARYCLERQDWMAAAELPPKGLKFPQAEAITYFARAIGSARAGRLDRSQDDIGKLKELRDALAKDGQPYWAEQLDIQVLAAQAWAAHGRGERAEALKQMRAAADLEDRSEKQVTMENRLYPMRELLGDMLRENGQGELALREYEASNKATPRRLRGLYGAAKAAQMSDQADKAASYFRDLAQLTAHADTDRPELTEARQFLARR
jgi:hypothetical protein